MCAGLGWCHIFHCNSINQQSARSTSSKLCCPLSEDICIPHRKTTYFTPAFVFQANLGPLSTSSWLLEPRLQQASSPKACVFILARRAHTPELRKSTDLHGSRLLLSRNTTQGGGERGPAPARSSSAPIQTGPDLVLHPPCTYSGLELSSTARIHLKIKMLEVHVVVFYWTVYSPSRERSCFTVWRRQVPRIRP